MVQLWVNLPASAKDTPAAYQTLLNKDIPRVSLEDDGGTLRVIAGEYLEHKGPANTFTPINVWDLRLEPGARVNLPVPEGYTTLVAVLNGSVQINETDILRDAELASLDREGQEVVLESNNDARLLVLSGEPIDEPVVGYGPFVMNTEGEIKQAMLDFQSGKFGAL